MKNLSLYFHIPFCTKKCPYCHFYVLPNRLPFHSLLGESIALEWDQQLPKIADQTVVSIYFGGGTPSLFHGIEEILNRIPRSSDCEITIEANPEESTQEMFAHFRKIGINRLSLGVQSLDDRSLQTLERIHSAEKAKKAIQDAKDGGFENISIDLMVDLPGQTEESLRHTLNSLADLNIQHLSLYNLTIEPHTAFHKRKVQPLQGKSSLRLLLIARDTLEAMGLKRYEISAFSFPGFQSIHNLGYWTGRPFLGFGPSAFSYWEKERFCNVANLQTYAKRLKMGLSPIDFQEKLPPVQAAQELLAIHLRLKSGANLNEFEISEEAKKAIERLKTDGLLKQRASQLQLTEKGMLFYDTVASEII